LVRLAQALGYDGFSDLQLVFRARLLLSFETWQDRVETLGPVPADGGSVLDGLVDEAIASLERLRASVPAATLAGAVEMLAAAEQVYLLAQGRPFPIASYLAFALSRLRKRCLLLDNAGGLVRQQ